MTRRTTRSTRDNRTRRPDPDTSTQAGLWGDDAPAPVEPAAGSAAGTNDVERWSRVLSTAADPGLMVTEGRRGARRVMRRVPGSDDHVAPVAAGDAAVVLQALASGHVELGTGRHQVRHGRYEGPAVRVLVPARTRSLLARWAALRPLRED